MPPVWFIWLMVAEFGFIVGYLGAFGWRVY